MVGSLGVVVPAYEPDVPALCQYVRGLDERLAPAMIRIELDAPTPAVVDALDDLPATVHVAERRRGKGAAITYGFEQLDTDVLALADADGSTPPSSMADVTAPVVGGDANLAVGSRRHPEAMVRSHQTYARRWLGHGFAWIARRMLEPPLYDYQCGAKAIDRAAWRDVRHHLYEPGFAWDIELIAMTAALDYRIAEIPIVWEDHPGSTVSPVDTTLELGRALLATRHRAKLLRDDPLHAAIDVYREDRPPLVNRSEWGDD